MKAKKKHNLIQVIAKKDTTTTTRGTEYIAEAHGHGLIKVLNNLNVWAWYHENDFIKKGVHDNAKFV